MRVTTSVQQRGSRAATACLAVAALAMLAGCNQGRSGTSANALAPGLADEGRPMRHNAADPNAPFSVLDATPHLAARPALLDVNEVEPCDPAKLDLYESRAQANGAHHTLRLTLENLGPACRLGGFPAISLLDGDGSVLGAIHIRKVSSATLAASLISSPSEGDAPVTDAPSPQVLLPAQGGADFQLGWVSGPTCRQAARIAIAAPTPAAARSPAVIISRPLSVCEDQVMITAIAASGSD